MKMDCDICNQDASDVEEYCHHCGTAPICFDCLDSEWCPDCIEEHWSSLPDRVKLESIKMNSG